MLTDAYDYTGKQTFNYPGSPVPIADANPSPATTQIPVTVMAPGTVADVDVAVFLPHTYVSDLELALISPLGTRVVLSSHHGDDDDDYGSATWWSRFDDESILFPVANYGGPFPGSYQPDGSLAALDGQPLSGTWTLEVIDDTAEDTGTLLGWSLIFKTNNPAQAGDFDGDGDVDGADFVAWQTHFPLASGATLADGDADADGDVDGADFVVWQTNFPFPPSMGITPVPEPGSWVTACLATPICLALVRRFRSVR
jgi:subtilisin-like proprotein convertase family protein